MVPRHGPFGSRCHCHFPAPFTHSIIRQEWCVLKHRSGGNFGCGPRPGSLLTLHAGSAMTMQREGREVWSLRRGHGQPVLVLGPQRTIPAVLPPTGSRPRAAWPVWRWEAGVPLQRRPFRCRDDGGLWPPRDRPVQPCCKLLAWAVASLTFCPSCLGRLLPSELDLWTP